MASRSTRVRRWSVAACTYALCLAGPGRAQDFQLLPLGQGSPGSECVLPGPDAALDSAAAGDDVALPPVVITSGSNGVCETALGGDDVRSPNGVVLGGGLPSGPLVVAGTPLANDGICDSPVTPLGDDVRSVPVGQSQPGMRAIAAGGDGTIDTSPSGDDVAAGIICPGPNTNFDSSTHPSDLLPAVNVLCQPCVGSAACITPGPDGLLQTVASGDDVLVPFVSTGADGIAQSTAADDDVQVIAPGSGFVDTVCVHTGADGLAQTSLCGNGTADLEENGLVGADCEDGNTTSGDGCSAICLAEFCGDGVEQAGLGEECDDGNARNDDACVVGCRDAACGDGFRWRGVEECEPPSTTTCDATCLRIALPRCGDAILDPGEQCDDGNVSNKDDCPTSCLEAVCGDGFLHTKGTPPFEQCDDGNTAPGDGCSGGCLVECGNGMIDGACSEGAVGAACSVDADCDTAPGNGRCVGEACDPGAALLCGALPPVCSNVCQYAACGNDARECDEQCDRGAANGVPGSGCSATCTRLQARFEARPRECLSSWSVDNPPQGPGRRVHRCRDGDPCDFDAETGQCTFRLGMCVNRTDVAGCTPGELLTVDLVGVRVGDPTAAAAVEAVTNAVRELAPSSGLVPDRCRSGLPGKVCSIPDDRECDSFFGAGNGACDIGTGVVFSPPLDPAALGGEQVSPCTPSLDVVVPAGRRLALRARSRQASGVGDYDTVKLVCR
jgi:cysteine-rich repeat protein